MTKWWFIFLAGCGASIPLTEYSAARTEADCVSAQKCGRLSPSVDCATQEFVDHVGLYEAALDTGAVRYDAFAAARCIAELNAGAACDFSSGFRPNLASCRSVFVTDAKEGDVCGGSCAAELVCTPDTLLCGRCTRVPTLIVGKEGEVCVSENSCGEGLFCSGRTSLNRPGIFGGCWT